MSKGNECSLPVRTFFHEGKKSLKLQSASGEIGFSKEIIQSATGQDLPSIQVWGKSEIEKIKRLSGEKRKEYIHQQLEDTACLILTEGLLYPSGVKKQAREKKTALFLTPLTKKKAGERLREILSLLKTVQTTLAGGLLKIFGLGVLVIGDSGIGKSESALELISRGHLFVSDDVVQIHKKPDGELEGTAAPLSRNFMEIRGLGIINIEKIFGSQSTCQKTQIDLVVALRKWEEGKEYDRLGLKFPESHEVLGANIPRITIPVAPGRNISTLIEVACKVFRLKKKGYVAAQEISKRLDRVLSFSK